MNVSWSLGDNISIPEKPLAHRAIKITLGAARTNEEAAVDELQFGVKKSSYLG